MPNGDASQAIEEALTEEKERELETLPESPASANLKVWIEGFGVMFTVRDTQASEVIAKILNIIALAQKKGWKPSWREEKEEVDPGWITGVGQEGTSSSASGPAIICAVHKMVMDRATKTGKPYHSYQGMNCSGEGWWPKRK